jgi:hypothetical protein
MHSTYLAVQGEIEKNDAASFLVLQGGAIGSLTGFVALLYQEDG